MRDPYEVLGVSANVTEDQVQEAYRMKSTFLPMNDPSDPRVKELNEAYDQIILTLRGQAFQTETHAGSGRSEFEDIRYMLQNGRNFEAQELLDGMPEAYRSAEWYFLKGTVFYNQGFIELSYENFQKATQMNPNNAEYASAFQQVSNYGKGAMPGSPYGSAEDVACNSGCDCCTTLLCLNCCLGCCRG